MEITIKEVEERVITKRRVERITNDVEGKLTHKRRKLIAKLRKLVKKEKKEENYIGAQGNFTQGGKHIGKNGEKTPLY